MKLFAVVLLLFITSNTHSQTFSVTGNVIGEDNKPLVSATVTVNQKDTKAYNSTTDKKGAFLISLVSPGKYYISIKSLSYEEYFDSVNITNDAPAAYIGNIQMVAAMHSLDEVKIVGKVVAMIQKDDTLEFNSGAFKVNPDADASDLVRKMPTLEIENGKITAQGENVVKIVVDGKPFFEMDPMTALKNLPADIIDKVQVYSEKSDQEKFTGFNEGSIRKTINIITKREKRNGIFGKAYAGGGDDINSHSENITKRTPRYGAGGALNNFAGNRRITITGQTNNINAQNFNGNSSNYDPGAGTATKNVLGLNYSNKLNKKMDFAGSYSYNQSKNSTESEINKTYLVAADSGLLYDEMNTTNTKSNGHRYSLRLSYKIDSMNSLLVATNGSFLTSNDNATRNGTTDQNNTPINATNNTSRGNGENNNFGSNALFQHRFHKKGRTFSVNITNSLDNANGTEYRNATNLYYTGASNGDTLDQRSIQQSKNKSIAANATYTEPIGTDGLLKIEYNYSYTPNGFDKNTNDYSQLTNTYAIANDLYSSTFNSDNSTNKGGMSYLHHFSKTLNISLGVNYQQTTLINHQSQPIPYSLNQDFQNVLPVATVRYKISKASNINCTYNTSAQPPSVTQLQNVINNRDPLHLYVGNQFLKQPYRHNLSLNYNGSHNSGQNTYAASFTGSSSRHNIVSSSIIAKADSQLAQSIVLHAGSQLSYPKNIEGNWTANTNIYYSLPLTFIKCRLNAKAIAGITRNPGIINNQVNYQENRNGSLGLTLNSSHSEYVDFSCSYTVSIFKNINSLNASANNSYLAQNTHASLNLVSRSGFVFNTQLGYQLNSGLTAGYNQNYLLCKASLGKKIFKKKKGEIRLSVFDLFNQNNNIQHTVTDTYIQNTRTNIIQRYFLMVFTYKFSGYKSAEPNESE